MCQTGRRHPTLTSVMQQMLTVSHAVLQVLEKDRPGAAAQQVRTATVHVLH